MPQKPQKRNHPIDIPHKIAIDLSYDEAHYQKMIIGFCHCLGNCESGREVEGG
jgi:hypothetical protein